MKTNRLAERALLIHYSRHGWTGKRKDKKTSERVAISANAESDAVDCIINLVSPSELKPMSQAWSRVDRVIKAYTLPWMDGGTRILPSDMFFTFRDKVKPPLEAYDQTVTDFANRYPDLVKKAPKRLGNLTATGHLPSPAEIRHRFRVEKTILPVQNVTDFRCDWADDEAESIKAEAIESFKASMSRAVQDLWTRLADLVGKIAETMAESDKRFRSSLFNNLKDFCTLLPKFNVMEDTNLEAVRKEVIEKLTKLDPEDIKEIPNHRKQAAKDAQELMEKIHSYIK